MFLFFLSLDIFFHIYIHFIFEMVQIIKILETFWNIDYLDKLKYGYHQKSLNIIFLKFKNKTFGFYLKIREFFSLKAD